MSADAPLPLPTGLRRVTLTALILSALVGFGSAQGLVMLLEPPPFDVDATNVKMLPMFSADPELTRKALQSAAAAELAALESMQASRGLILVMLSVASALVSMSALRMFRPGPELRDDVRKRLGLAAVVMAVFRTLEGAQSAAVMGRSGSAFDKVLSQSTAIPGGWPEGMMSNMSTALSAVLTFVIGGALVLLAMYFRSDKTRAATVALDGPKPPTA